MVTTLGSLFLYCISKQPETPNFQSLYQSLPWSDSWGSFFHVHPQTIDFSCKHCLLALPSADYWLQLQSPPVGLPSANHWVQLQSPSVGFAIWWLALPSANHRVQLLSPSVGFAIGSADEFSSSLFLLVLPSCHTSGWLCLWQNYWVQLQSVFVGFAIISHQ